MTFTTGLLTGGIIGFVIGAVAAVGVLYAFAAAFTPK